jgi:hypothetical protein
VLAWITSFILNFLADKLGIAWAQKARENRAQKAGEVIGAAKAAGSIAQAQAERAKEDKRPAKAEEIDDVLGRFR